MKHALTLLFAMSLSTLLADDISREKENENERLPNLQIIIPVLNISDMSIPEAILHMQEAYEKETGKLIPIFLSPKAAAKETRINVTTRNTEFIRNLQYFCSGRTANLSYSLKGNAIFIYEPFEEDYKFTEVNIEPGGSINSEAAPLRDTP
ncbi:hypothetical protein DDZ13_15270 [Coraliomargarita sinensis]|uniref:Uncharacterized protein n=1 Tax=Coraliomargarita sinensis TaxID=2174842 RepID=A0A317ZHF9_9BACT|nr:hypothetical protein [Coraliomargarita sinensis]PXA02801.1 hypothetical protein DDZ13_15270 [Coraliomargarita sinensis]